MAKYLLPILAAALLAGCAHKGKSLDEFAVARNAPLVIPPDYTLTPPVAGAVSSSPEGAQQQAIDALFGGPAPRSGAEVSALEAAGRDRAALGIRSTVGDPTTLIVDKGGDTRTLLAAPQGDGRDASAQVGQ
jgi:hypothetical protein